MDNILLTVGNTAILSSESKEEILDLYNGYMDKYKINKTSSLYPMLWKQIKEPKKCMHNSKKVNL